MKVQGGKSVYGATLGILMLDAKFPRVEGDMGNALTWPFPVQYKVVEQASPDRVVLNRAEGLKDRFIAAGKELVKQGADGITTNCGFLSLFQSDLAGELNVPVASSSLMQVPLVQKMLPPDQLVGILTISAETLDPDHLALAGVPDNIPISGTEGGQEFSRVILNDELEMDIDLARQDNVGAAMDLIDKNQNIGAIVLECTNMVPYAADIRRATGRPVFSIYNFAVWFQAGLLPKRYNQLQFSSRTL